MRTLLALLLAVTTTTGTATATARRPNFVFLVSEDNSIHYLRLYGAKLGQTPNIDRMAANGLTFNHAFSCSPVCSVARSTLATGIFAPRGGFQYHRKSKPARLPAGFQPWSATLRAAGYYTTNRRKTDYNFVGPIKAFWNQSSRQASWRNRPKTDMPFFHMQSFGQSHESSLHFPLRVMEQQKTTTPPEEVTLAPYHPDTPTFRYTHARYIDRMAVIDVQVGRVLKQLKQDGLLEDTFVFYFGDHGGVLPRSKGYAYESGLHVPLVVRIPANFRQLVDHRPNTRTDGFVSFVDFGPTVLHLAGLPVPPPMDGRPFLGQGITAKALGERDEAFGYADRFDEKYDMVRSLRKGKFTYIRNYQGFYPDGLQNNYRYRMLAFSEWRDLHRAGKLNAFQRQFFESRPAEQLFDVKQDPHQVHNLANDPRHATTLALLRERLRDIVIGINDLSFFPESHMVAKALDRPITFGKSQHDKIAAHVAVADLCLQPVPKIRDRLVAALDSQDPWQRYWACIACSVSGQTARPLVDNVKPLLKDTHPLVRVRAAEFLGSIRATDPMPTLYDVLNNLRTEQELMLTFNTVVFLRDFRGYPFDASRLKLKFTGGEIHRRVDYLRGAIKQSRIDYFNHQDLGYVLDVNGLKHPVRTAADWRRRRQHILLGLQRVMGSLPTSAQRVPLDVRTSEEVKLGAITRRKLSYQSDAKHRVSAFLFLPGNSKAAAVLCLQQTHRPGKVEAAGISGNPDLAYALHLAKRGYVTLAPDYPGFGESKYDFSATHGYASGTMTAIWDNIRAVDFLQTLDTVDAQRIGVIGHSLGGHNAMFTAAFEPRLKVIVSSCGFTRFHKDDVPSWTGPRYMPRIATLFGNDADRVPFDFPEIIGSFAPRPFLAIAAKRDADFDVSGVQDSVASAASVYRLLKAPRHLAAHYPNIAHSFPKVSQRVAYAFFDQHLKGTRP